MDEENVLSTTSDEITPRSEIIISDSPITDSTDIIQNVSLSTSSSIALQVINLDPNYSGEIRYVWRLTIHTPAGPGASVSSTIERVTEDTGGDTVSPVEIFTELSSECTYEATCDITYEDYVEGSMGGLWFSKTISCTLGTSSYQPDFNNTEINWIYATDTSISVQLINLDSAYQENYNIVWFLYNDTGSLIGAHTALQSGGSSISDEYEFTGLSPESDYIVDARIDYGESSSYDKISSCICTTEPAEWVVSTTQTLGYIESKYSNTRDYGAGEVVRFKFYFANSGEAKFYSLGSGDTIGYLGTSTSYNTEEGCPVSYKRTDDNSGDGNNFSLTYNVTAETTYYFWVRHYNYADSGQITFCIVPPGIEDEQYPLPTTSNTELIYAISGSTAVVEIQNFNPEYDLDNVILTRWTVTCLTTGDVILDAEEKRSDEDDSYCYIQFDRETDYQYQIYVEVEGYPDFLNADVDVWTSVIHIEADIWTVFNAARYTNCSTTQMTTFTLDPCSMARITLSFANDGTVQFYSSGSTDTKAYLGTDDAYDGSTGIPIDYLESDDDGNGNRQFLISYNVSEGTTYYLWVRGYSDSTSGSTTVHIKLAESGATLNASSSDDGTSIIAYISGLDTDYSRTDRYIYWYLNNTSNYVGKTYINAGVSETEEFSNFGALTPGNTYQIYAEIYYTGDGQLFSKTLGPKSVTTNKPRPDYFDWNTDKIQNQEIVITADEWTNLQENINLVRKYKGYSNYSFTIAYVGNNITASMYNECISAINTIYSTSITSYKVSVGDTITAEAINNLQFFINNVE